MMHATRYVRSFGFLSGMWIGLLFGVTVGIGSVMIVDMIANHLFMVN